MTASTPATPRMSTCRFCWQPIVSAGLWVHTGTRRASCAGGVLPIAEPESPAAQAALFDLPPAGRIGGVR